MEPPLGLSSNLLGPLEEDQANQNIFLGSKSVKRYFGYSESDYLHGPGDGECDGSGGGGLRGRGGSRQPPALRPAIIQ